VPQAVEREPLAFERVRYGCQIGRGAGGPAEQHPAAKEATFEIRLREETEATEKAQGRKGQIPPAHRIEVA